MQPFLDTFPDTENLRGVDFDPLLLPLAQDPLRLYGARMDLILADLRSDVWRAQLPDSFDAVISATALHWLTEDHLASLCRQLAEYSPSRRSLRQRRPCCQPAATRAEDLGARP
jgi:hypothetical protein